MPLAEAEAAFALADGFVVSLVDGLAGGNMIAVAWLDDGSAWLATDNKYRGRPRQPSRLYFIPASMIR